MIASRLQVALSPTRRGQQEGAERRKPSQRVGWLSWMDRAAPITSAGGSSSPTGVVRPTQYAARLWARLKQEGSRLGFLARIATTGHHV